MTSLASTLTAAAASAEGTGLLCTILLFAVVVSFVLGLAQVLGVDGGRLNATGGRFGTLVVFVVLLIAYVLFC